jgi:uncharacterized protein (TIGR01732 family)
MYWIFENDRNPCISECFQLARLLTMIWGVQESPKTVQTWNLAFHAKLSPSFSSTFFIFEYDEMKAYMGGDFEMGFYGGYGCGGYGYGGGYGCGGGFALIVVLFILLIIVGAVIWS